MSTIQIKRGLSTKLGDLTLLQGEPAFSTDTGKLYVGDGTNNVLVNPIDKPAGIDTVLQYTKVKVNEYGQVVSLDNVTANDLPSDIPINKITGIGSAATKNAGTAAGELPILDSNGKLDTNVIPSVAITDVFTANTQAAMLALDVEKGDICIRTDLMKTFILKQSPAATLANWAELATPTDMVQSVNTKTGVVILNSGDIAMTGYSKPATGGAVAAEDTITAAVGKIEKNLDSYAPLASPTLTGTPIAPTASTGTNTTQISTTAFVTSAITDLNISQYARLASPSLTGIPTAPTAALGTSTTQLATTAFVTAAFANIDGGTF